MANNKKRPVDLNLFKIRLPVSGIVSIVHRVTGVLLVLLLPFSIYMLQRSLQDPAAFRDIAARLGTPAGRFALLIIVWVLAQHFFSGIRHLLLDIDVGIEIVAARRGAWLTFAASLLVVVLTGVYL
ncbi:MAG: succinate dehydrogenase, cytochrome b556 subunit [Sulfuricaulis sp.]